jgi:hypothetical protein
MDYRSRCRDGPTYRAVDCEERQRCGPNRPELLDVALPWSLAGAGSRDRDILIEAGERRVEPRAQTRTRGTQTSARSRSGEPTLHGWSTYRPRNDSPTASPEFPRRAPGLQPTATRGSDKYLFRDLVDVSEVILGRFRSVGSFVHHGTVTGLTIPVTIAFHIIVSSA